MANDLTTHRVNTVTAGYLMRLCASRNAAELPAAIRETRAAMVPAERGWIAGRAAALLSHYWQPDEPPEMIAARLNDWTDDLSGFPQWAITAACKRYRQGETRRPVPADIVTRCAAEMAPVRVELGKAVAALEAHNEPPRAEPSEESKARIAAMVASVGKRLKS